MERLPVASPLDRLTGLADHFEKDDPAMHKTRLQWITLGAYGLVRT